MGLQVRHVRPEPFLTRIPFGLGLVFVPFVALDPRAGAGPAAGGGGCGGLVYLPVEIVEKEGSINVNYKSNEEILDIKKKYPEFFNNDPLITISNFVQKDTTLIKKIINHPIVRKMVYEYLSQNKLTSNVVLKEYSSIDDVNYSA